MLQLQNSTYFSPTKYERRQTIGEIKYVKARIHIICLPFLKIIIIILLLYMYLKNG